MTDDEKDTDAKRAALEALIDETATRSALELIEEMNRLPDRVDVHYSRRRGARPKLPRPRS